MRPVILLGLCLFLTGCPDDRPAPIAPPAVEMPTPLLGQAAPKAGKDGKVDPLEQAKYDALRYAEAAAQAEARYATMKQQAADDSLRSQVMWITGLCLLFAAICGVMAFIAPVGKKTLAAAAVGFTAIAACAQAFQWAVPYLPWIGGVVLIGGGIWGAINWKKLGAAVKVAADHGDRMEEWLKDLPAEAREQAKQIIADAKKETQKQAIDLGVDNPLQYLRGKIPSLWQRITNKLG